MIDLEALDELYQDVENRYKNLDDGDLSGALSLMKDSSGLIPSYERLSADYQKECAIQERRAKALQAQISCEKSSSVAKGDREAIFDEAVVTQWKTVAECQKVVRYLDASAKFLNRVYFDAKMIVEHIYKKELPPGRDKMLGGR